MRLRISHTTEYRYDDPVQYSLQRLRLCPLDSPGQKIVSWNIAVDGANVEAGFNDQFGNHTHLVSTEGDSHSVHIVASGEVETEDRSGVFGPHQGYVPLWLYLRDTPLTKPGKLIHVSSAPLELTVKPSIQPLATTSFSGGSNSVKMPYLAGE